MTELQNLLQGLWLPLITPFRNGELDEPSLRRLVRHYTAHPMDGLILAATSGEGMTLTIAELERLVSVVRAEISNSAVAEAVLQLSNVRVAKHVRRVKLSRYRCRRAWRCL